MGQLPRLLSMAVGAAMALAACKGGEEGAPPPPAATPTAAPPARGSTPLGVRWERLREGSGEPPAPGRKVRLRFSAMAGDGVRDEGEVAFAIGDGRTLPGLDEVARVMKVGEVLVLEMPASAAFGGRARGPVAPDTPITMEVELLAIEP